MNPFPGRLSKLFEALRVRGLDGLALTPGPSLVYLTGFHFYLTERPVLALFSAEGQGAIVLPELELSKAAEQPMIQPFAYSEDPTEWPQAFQRAIRTLNLEGKYIGIEPLTMRLMEFRYLEEAASPSGKTAHFLEAQEVVGALRLRKDAEEIASIRKAVAIAEKVLEATLPLIKIGMRECDLAAELLTQLMRNGSQPDLPFDPIISTGPNSANPHATPTERTLQAGDLLVIDWGARLEGYVSDLTRTFAVGEVGAEERKIHALVCQANQAARMMAKAGIACNEVDRAARKIIEEAGYGPYFIHRIGHGLGLDAHEPPYLRDNNPQELEAGMVFTVEPGIYLPGRNGVRIEDDLVITGEGAECLSRLSRELISVG